MIITNKPQAGVIQRAERLGVPCHYFTNAELREGTRPIALMKEHGVELIILAGYLCLITPIYVMEYPERIINIHPALLPSFGGQGMYGDRVHTAVIASGAKESGITIHLVDEDYDHGRHLLQATCPVRPDDTVDTLAARIHELEHRFCPTTIAQYLRFLYGGSSHTSPSRPTAGHVGDPLWGGSFSLAWRAGAHIYNVYAGVKGVEKYA